MRACSKASRNSPDHVKDTVAPPQSEVSWPYLGWTRTCSAGGHRSRRASRSDLVTLAGRTRDGYFGSDALPLRELRRVLGYREFAEVEGELRVWVDARVWTTGEGRKALFDASVGWLLRCGRGRHPPAASRPRH
jgi:hypothetical protein